jgi:hypothetical protein
LLPFTVRVKADPPAIAEPGESDVAIGSGLTDASTVTGGLVAASVSSSPINRRNSYVPGVSGIVTVHARSVTPAPT